MVCGCDVKDTERTDGVPGGDLKGAAWNVWFMAVVVGASIGYCRGCSCRGTKITDGICGCG